MNKAELIDKLAKDADITKTQANAAIDSFTNSVVGALKKGDRVTLVGFGTFSVSERSARSGRNPKTGAVIKIKAKKANGSRGSPRTARHGQAGALSRLPLMRQIDRLDV